MDESSGINEVAESGLPSVLTGRDLLDAFSGKHPYDRDCPGCGEPVTRCAITKLAYAYDTCSCDLAEWDHLVERVWHLPCLTTAAPGEAAVALLRSASWSLARYKRGREQAAEIDAFLASRREPQ